MSKTEKGRTLPPSEPFEPYSHEYVIACLSPHEYKEQLTHSFRTGITHHRLEDLATM